MTLVRNSWSQTYYFEYFGVSEYLLRSAGELKQIQGILAQTSQKKKVKQRPKKQLTFPTGVENMGEGGGLSQYMGEVWGEA